MPFIGTTPAQGFASSVNKQSFTANGSTTSFTLTHQVSNANDLEVFVGNVRQEPTAAYTASGTTLDFGSGNAPPNGVNLYVIYKNLAQVTTAPPDGSVSNAKITGMASSKLSGALPAIDGTALTGTGLGVGQTWTDVTSSRAKTTEYQNTTGKPIMVSVNFTTDFTQRGQLQVSSSSGSGFIIIADADGGDYYSAGDDTDHYANISVIIPNNIYYKLIGAPSDTLVLRSWTELR